jgi:precorrin-4 methylase
MKESQVDILIIGAGPGAPSLAALSTQIQSDMPSTPLLA